MGNYRFVTNIILLPILLGIIASALAYVYMIYAKPDVELEGLFWLLIAGKSVWFTSLMIQIFRYRLLSIGVTCVLGYIIGLRFLLFSLLFAPFGLNTASERYLFSLIYISILIVLSLLIAEFLLKPYRKKTH